VFQFGNFDYLTDYEVALVIHEKTPADPSKGYVPCYHYDIALHGSTQIIGALRFRVGTTDQLFYPGHIGYEIEEDYRGNHYAEKACRLLRPVALFHGLKALTITCRPDNTPSRRTIERLGGVLLGTFQISPIHPMYSEYLAAGHKPITLRYEWTL
jgi:tagatose 1,6-diphosphate aldolase